jgi:putative oxidoreductase
MLLSLTSRLKIMFMADTRLALLGGLGNYGDLALLFLRLTVAIFFIVSQGIPKLFGKSRQHERETFMGRGVGGPVFDLVGVAELLGGVFLLFGIITRISSIVLAILMVAVILFNVKVMSKPPVNKRYIRGWDLDTVLLAGIVALAIFGAGAYSLDFLLGL